ncbi:MAG: hypothetical protein H7X77_04195 [Anaerolineae bacterium]|nr:hypothetical protein [Anaerolineae bacterium]
MTARVTDVKAEVFKKQRWRWLLGKLWFVHPPVFLLVNASPGICLQTMAVTARPSTERLHHRNLFASGRRYYLTARERGFRLTTTSKVSWSYRRRTRSAAVMQATFSVIHNDITRIQMESHISLTNLLEFSLLPTFMTSIIVYIPWWHPSVIVGCIIALYTLSWFGHRYNATLEANEMVFFVQKALEDLEPAVIMSLEAKNLDVVYEQRDFDAEWEKFYRRHSDENHQKPAR